MEVCEVSLITTRCLSVRVVSDSRRLSSCQIHKPQAVMLTAVRRCTPSIMSKFLLLVFCCVLVGCLADPHRLQSWLRERAWTWRPRGCGDRQAARAACAGGAGGAGVALAAHPHDCRLFYYCRGAAPPACRRCPFSLHFNPALQVCDWPQNANCTARSPPPPRPRPCLPSTPSSTPSSSAAPKTTATADVSNNTHVVTDPAPSTDASSSSSTDVPSSSSPAY